MNVVEETDEYPLRKKLGNPPTDREMIEAMWKLKGGKAGGRSGILPATVKVCGGEIFRVHS